MNYFINPSSFTAVFTLPCDVVDKHLKLADETKIKVLLYALRNLSAGIDATAISDTLSLPLSEAEDALLYWVQAGILGSSGVTTNEDKDLSKPVLKNAKPSRQDVARRGLEDERVRFLMAQAQQHFGRGLKTNESSSLLWLYDDLGMDISVILLLLQYAANSDKLNISFIEKTALFWIKNNVKSVADAEAQIAETARKNTAWHIVETAFGIKHRNPSPKELEKADRWLNEWEISRELLHCAYNACVDQKSEFIFSYTAKVLEDWHKRGIKTAEDVEKDASGRAKETEKTQKQSSLDIEAFEKMLDTNY